MRTEVITMDGSTAVFAGDQRDAGADVIPRGAAVEIHFHTRGGHVPPEVRGVLIDAVFNLPELQGHRRLLASVPIGDAELIAQLRRRCESIATRAAGATCLIDAEVEALPAYG
jgi:hypothetical protein